MSKWIYQGYTKVKVGTGRNARFKEVWEYMCSYCKASFRITAGNKPPSECPHCGRDMEGSVCKKAAK